MLHSSSLPGRFGEHPAPKGCIKHAARMPHLKAMRSMSPAWWPATAAAVAALMLQASPPALAAAAPVTAGQVSIGVASCGRERCSCAPYLRALPARRCWRVHHVLWMATHSWCKDNGWVPNTHMAICACPGVGLSGTTWIDHQALISA